MNVFTELYLWETTGRGVRHWLCRLNADGEVVFDVYFLSEGFWSNGKETFMVTVPSYEDKEIEITMEMKKQAYFSEDDGRYYFNVTEAQYDELTKGYFQAWEKSKEELKKVTYTYEELFSDSTSFRNTIDMLAENRFMKGTITREAALQINLGMEEDNDE